MVFYFVLPFNTFFHRIDSESDLFQTFIATSVRLFGPLLDDFQYAVFILRVILH
jgi:hypothetical protein